MSTSAEVKRRRAEYLAAHPQCEYTQAIGPKTNFPGNFPATEVDHIFGRNGPEDAAEHPSNYMAADHAVHSWKTDNDRDGRIVAIWWKHRHGELDCDRIKAVFGQWPLGWLSNQLDKDGLPWWIREMAEEVLDGGREETQTG